MYKRRNVHIICVSLLEANFAFSPLFEYDRDMKKYLSIFLVFFLCNLGKGIFAEEGYIGENPGLSFYSQIDEWNYTITQKMVRTRLRETPTLWVFAKKCLSEQLKSIIGSAPTDAELLDDISLGRYEKLSDMIQKSGKSISSDMFQSLTDCLIGRYDAIIAQARDEQKNMENWSFIGLYTDGDTTNSDYDIVADIDKINSIIFSENLKYSGAKNTSAKSLKDLLEGKKVPPLFPLWSTGARLYESGTLGVLPGNTLAWWTPPSGWSQSWGSNLSTLIGWNCGPSGISSLADLENDPYFSQELRGILDGQSSGPNSGYAPGIDASTPSTSWSTSERSPNTPKTSGSDFFHSMPCTTIFCIKISMVAGSENALWWGKNISIEGILDKHKKILEPISESALRDEKMTNNFASLPFFKLKLPQTIAGLRVFLADSPQRTRNDKRDETPARKDEELEQARRCAFFSAGLDTDKTRANAILWAGYNTRGSTTSETAQNTVKPLWAQEVADLARYSSCMESAITWGRKAYYDSFSTDLSEIGTFTRAILAEIEDLVTTGTKLNNKPVK